MSGIPSRRTRAAEPPGLAPGGFPRRSCGTASQTAGDPPGLPVVMVLLTALMAFAAEPAFAADELFKTKSPLLIFIDFMTGPFAYGVTIMALVVTVGALMFGAEFSGFGRRMPIVVVAGAIVILASTVVKNLFGADRAADVPIGHDLGVATSLVPDALSPGTPMDHGWLITVGLVLAGIGLGVLWSFRGKAVGRSRVRRRLAREASAARPGSRPEGTA